MPYGLLVECPLKVKKIFAKIPFNLLSRRVEYPQNYSSLRVDKKERPPQLYIFTVKTGGFPIADEYCHPKKIFHYLLCIPLLEKMYEIFFKYGY
jgi:hypothetical protein